MTKIRSAEKEEFWRLAIAEQLASGMTIKEFCRQQGFAAHAFSWWKREIRKRDQFNSHNDSDSHAGDMRLIPVTVTAIPSSAIVSCAVDGVANPAVEVVSPTGYKLCINCELPPPYLTALLDAVTACKAIGGTP